MYFKYLRKRTRVEGRDIHGLDPGIGHDEIKIAAINLVPCLNRTAVNGTTARVCGPMWPVPPSYARWTCREILMTSLATRCPTAAARHRVA
jgi:hypothetical protein